ncbi:MAG: DUF2203 domain-containing protein [Planctomycetota bacterium]
MAPQQTVEANYGPLADTRTLFTLERAQSALPYVSRVVVDVRETYARIVALRRELESAPNAETATELESAYAASMDRLGDLVDELHAVGVELRDFERGEVDFPARSLDGEISLCWDPEQPSIAHWRDDEPGARTRPIATMPDLLAA